MTQTAVPSAWTEFCRIGVMRGDGDALGTEYQFDAMTEDISAMDWGEKDIEGMPLVNGGRVVKKVPMTDESITLKMYPTDTLLNNTGVAQNMHSQSAIYASGNSVAFNANKRDKHRLVMLWTPTLPKSPAAASSETLTGNPAVRMVVANAYCTSYKPNFDDKIFSAEVTFKWTPFDKDGTPNKKEESTQTSNLAAVTASHTALVPGWSGGAL